MLEGYSAQVDRKKNRACIHEYGESPRAMASPDTVALGSLVRCSSPPLVERSDEKGMEQAAARAASRERVCAWREVALPTTPHVGFNRMTNLIKRPDGLALSVKPKARPGSGPACVFVSGEPFEPSWRKRHDLVSPLRLKRPCNECHE